MIYYANGKYIETNETQSIVFYIIGGMIMSLIKEFMETRAKLLNYFELEQSYFIVDAIGELEDCLWFIENNELYVSETLEHLSSENYSIVEVVFVSTKEEYTAVLTSIDSGENILSFLYNKNMLTQEQFDSIG